MSDEIDFGAVVGGILVGLLFVAYFLLRTPSKPKSEPTSDNIKNSGKGKSKSKSKQNKKPAKKKKVVRASKKSNAKKTAEPLEREEPTENALPLARARRAAAKHRAPTAPFEHELLLKQLKGHSGPTSCIAFSPDGKFVATSGGVNDEVVLVMAFKSLRQSANPQYVRVKLDNNSAAKVAFTPDSKQIACVMRRSSEVQLFNISTAKPELRRSFPIEWDGEDLTFLLAGAKPCVYLLTTGQGDDGMMRFWSLKGDTLKSVRTNQLNSRHSAVSGSGRFVAHASFSSEVRVWEVARNKTSGQFEQVARAMALKGHSRSVHSVDFGGSDTRAVTASKDGTWKLWDIDVRYRVGADPRCLLTGLFPHGCADIDRIALSPGDHRHVVAAAGHSLLFFCAATADLLQVIPNAVPGGVSSLSFHPRGNVLATSSFAAKHARLWTVPGHASASAAAAGGSSSEAAAAAVRRRRK